MNDVEMKRNCVDCGQEFTIPPYQQMFYTNRGWELPKRCKACREKKKQEWCCTIKVDIENSKGQYIEKDKQEATKDGSESTKIQHGI